MVYDEGLAERIAGIFSVKQEFEVKKMFGGLCYMSKGHMVVGIVGDELMVRVGKENWESALTRPHAREMDFTGKPMKGMIYVAKPGFESGKDLESWIDLALSFTNSLEPK